MNLMHMSRMMKVATILSLSLIGCTTNARGDYESLSAGPPGPPVATSSDDTGGSSSTGDEFEDRLDLPDYDTDGAGGYDPDGHVDSCKKVDFLFVIDNSGSMSDNQQNLIDNFQNFIAAIEQVLPELESIHLGVVTTDTFSGNPGPCQKLGALVTTTQDELCGPYADGHNFMTEADDLETSFECAAALGTNGSGTEQPVEAAIQALEGFLNSQGQCNEGFNRNDAFTVIVIVTDEDLPYNQNAGVAYDHFIYLEGSDENMVLLTLTHTEDSATVCESTYGTTVNQDLIGFTEQFTWGFVGELCEKNYKPFLDSAVAVIDTACVELPGSPPEP